MTMTMLMMMMYDDVCQSAQTSQRMTLTFMVCLLKTTISQTGIVGFEKNRIRTCLLDQQL